MVYKGICTTCEEKENIRLNNLKEADPNIEDLEKLRITTEYIGETCKSLHTRSNQHLDGYRLMEKNNFILKHHVTHHPELKLGEVKIRFETHKKCQTSFRRQISEAVAIKLSTSDHNKTNINNKFEYTRCILPDIGALDPEEVEKKREEELDEKIDRLREEVRKLPQRTVEGSRRKCFPDKTPDELLRRKDWEENKDREERGSIVKQRLKQFEFEQTTTSPPRRRTEAETQQNQTLTPH